VTGPDIGASIRAGRLDKARAMPQDDLTGAVPPSRAEAAAFYGDNDRLSRRQCLRPNPTP